jgi:hypothetical protein
MEQNRDYPEYDSDDNFIGWGPRRSSYPDFQYYGTSRALPGLITSFLDAISEPEEPKKYESFAPPLVFLKPGENYEKKEQIKPRARWEDDPDDNYWNLQVEESEPEPEQIPEKPVIILKKPEENNGGWSKKINVKPTPKPAVVVPPVVYNKNNKQPPKTKNQKKYNNYSDEDDEPFEFYDRKGQSVYKY